MIPPSPNFVSKEFTLGFSFYLEYIHAFDCVLESLVTFEAKGSPIIPLYPTFFNCLFKKKIHLENHALVEICTKVFTSEIV